jgi:hypothetical protein
VSFNSLAYKYVTSTYTVLNTDYYIEASGTFSVTLPTAVGITGSSFMIKNSGTGEITVQTTSSQLIDNLPSYNLAFYDTLLVESNGANWLVGQPQTKQFIRVYNNTGSIIPKGTALSIQSAYNGIPSVDLPISSGAGNQQVIGLAYIDIPIASEGIAVSSGILSGLNLSSYSIGDILYLSDTVAGDYIASASTLQFSSRTNQIGYVTNNSSTLGTIQVQISNEDINLTLTDIERNILEGNVLSTGVYEYTPGLTKISGTTFSISAAKGWIVNNTYAYSTLPDVTNVIFAGATGLSTPYLSSDTATYVLLSVTASIILQPTFPSPAQRRENIYLGKVVHPDLTSILNVNNTPDFDVSPYSSLRDLWVPIKLINSGVTIRPDGANLSFQMSGGVLWGNGINWVNNQLNPNSVAIGGQNPVTFQYRTQSGGVFSNTTTIDATNYDNAGTLTSISGAQYTNQRVYLFPTGLVRIQYGQQTYTTLSKAITGILDESFQEYVNNRDNGILIGIISIKNGSSDLNDTNDVQFTAVSKFGELLGGSAGGVSTTTLQGAYDNSTSNPEILTNATLGPVNLRRGSVSDIDNVLTVQNGSGTDTLKVQGDGRLTLNGPIVLNTSSSSGLTTGTTSIVSFTASAGNGSYFDYHLSGHLGERRTGTVMATWYGTSSQFTDTSTPDLNGSTRGIEFNVDIISGNVTLQSVVSSGTWSVHTGIRII